MNKKVKKLIREIEKLPVSVEEQKLLREQLERCGVLEMSKSKFDKEYFTKIYSVEDYDFLVGDTHGSDVFFRIIKGDKEIKVRMDEKFFPTDKYRGKNSDKKEVNK